MFSSGPLEARLLQLEAAISEIKQVNADASSRKRINPCETVQNPG